MLWTVDWTLSQHAYNEIRVIGDVLFLAIISGAFHLDGLADTADGFFSHRPKEQILGIMKDSRVGVMGVLALIFCLLVKMAGIIEIKEPALWLIIIPALARTTQVIGLFTMDHARSENGLASDFYQKGKGSALLFCPIPFALIFFLDITTGIIALVSFSLLVSGFLYLCKSLIGGITGDTLGAATEITEAYFFAFAGIASTYL